MASKLYKNVVLLDLNTRGNVLAIVGANEELH